MTYPAIARFVVAVLPAAALVACSEQSPVAPSAAADGIERPIALAQAALGQYDLEFVWSGTALTLLAHIKDANGVAATGGSVVFQYCSLRGVPTDDITQPDESPASVCADRSGRWVTLVRAPLNASGTAGYSFGPVTVVTVIGFRAKYSPQGSGIASQTLEEDWFRPL